GLVAVDCDWTDRGGSEIQRVDKEVDACCRAGAAAPKRLRPRPEETPKPWGKREDADSYLRPQTVERSVATAQHELASIDRVFEVERGGYAGISNQQIDPRTRSVVEEGDIGDPAIDADGVQPKVELHGTQPPELKVDVGDCASSDGTIARFVV